MRECRLRAMDCVGRLYTMCRRACAVSTRLLQPLFADSLTMLLDQLKTQLTPDPRCGEQNAKLFCVVKPSGLKHVQAAQGSCQVAAVSLGMPCSASCGATICNDMLIECVTEYVLAHIKRRAAKRLRQYIVTNRTS